MAPTDEIFQIAVAGAVDAPALARFGEKTFIESFGHLYSPENLQLFLHEHHTDLAYRRLMENPDYRVWFAASLDGEPVAYAVAGKCTLPVEQGSARAGEIKRLYVGGRHQSSGLGRRLMEEMTGWFETEGFNPVYLSVYARNYGAHRFYARYGFEKVMEYEFVVGNHRDPEFIFQCSR